MEATETRQASRRGRKGRKARPKVGKRRHNEENGSAREGIFSGMQGDQDECV